MSKPIILTEQNWAKLRFRLREDYGNSVMLIRSRMREKLGFVDREHTWWDPRAGYITQICLDFYDEPKRLMFLLKYTEFLSYEKEKTTH